MDLPADPFHRGEHAAQARAGVRLQGAPIRGWMPDQHRQFFAHLPVLFAAVADGTGWPMATVLAGPPGFVSSLEAHTLRISTLPGQDDPAAPGLRTGAAIGLLGIDLATRRRNRVNGTVVAIDGHGFTVGVQQSFGNCPQYIQAREIEGEAKPPEAGLAEYLDHLDEQARTMITGADTLFVASSSGAQGGDAGGVDVSHRGGRAGFVRVDGGVLTIPDFRGNRYFNTLGNLMLEPRASLLFVNFATGDLLHLQGRTELDWDSGAASNFTGAERLWRMKVTAGWRRPGALAMRWSFRGYAPTTERTGRWDAT